MNQAEWRRIKLLLHKEIHSYGTAHLKPCKFSCHASFDSISTGQWKQEHTVYLYINTLVFNIFSWYFFKQKYRKSNDTKYYEDFFKKIIAKCIHETVKQIFIIAKSYFKNSVKLRMKAFWRVHFIFLRILIKWNGYKRITNTLSMQIEAKNCIDYVYGNFIH